MTTHFDLPTSTPSPLRAAVVGLALLAAGLMLWFALAAASLAPWAGSSSQPVPAPAPPPLELGVSPR
ncbi:MAG: hypothetical protein M3R05_01385 [Chloroflexota bacterium]|nr:hypothetical protein [Chloroflexota bacterium]